MTTLPLRVALACPHAVLAQALAAALAAPGFEVSQYLATDPDVAADVRLWLALSDYQDPLRWPRLGRHPPVVAMGSGDDGLALAWLRAGARGWLDLGADLAQVRKALHRVANGDWWAPHRLIGPLLEPLASPAADGLTAQEQRIAAAVAAGKRNKEIAAAFAIAETTVKAHLNRIYRKLNVNDRLQLALRLANRQPASRLPAN